MRGIYGAHGVRGHCEISAGNLDVSWQWMKQTPRQRRRRHKASELREYLNPLGLISLSRSVKEPSASDEAADGGGEPELNQVA